MAPKGGAGVSIEGIVIRTFPSGNADLVLRVISAGRGKMSVLAKNARKSAKRFGGSLDVFDRGRFELRTGRGSLKTVESFLPAAAFKKLRTDLDKLRIASLLCECFDRLVNEEPEHDGESHHLLTLSLEAIEECTAIQDMLRAAFTSVSALLRMAGFLGAEPEFLPTSNNFRTLVQRIEEVTERALLTKGAFLEVLEALRRPSFAARIGTA